METGIAKVNNLDTICAIVTDGLTSNLSRVMYKAALQDFLLWANGRPLTKAAVQAYKVELQGKGYSPATVNQKLSAIRKLASEAADNGMLDQIDANGISHVHGVKSSGIRSGNWLTKEQAQQLLNAPDLATLKGFRDRAILAVMLGGGLRRSEVAGLEFSHVQQREGRWVIVDLIGKGNRVRTVPIPSWAKAAIDEWAQAANLTRQGRVFRRINKGDNLAGDDMTDQAIADVVKHYAGISGLQVAAHDLRRSFAKLALRGGADLQQIQLTLGHASIQTTERYLGVQQDLTSAPCDNLGLRLE